VPDPEPLGDTIRSAHPAGPAEQVEKVGRYVVTGALGKGGMGEVLLVWDDDLGRELAAKVVRGKSAGQLMARLVLEARVTGQLEHPNIVPVHELGTADDGRAFFTMQRVQGDTLSDVLRRDPPPSLVEALNIFQKICDALRFAHDRGVIHRDLKPDNIMVGQFGEVQVMDWGLAKVLGATEEPLVAGADSSTLTQVSSGGSGSQTLDGSIMGTPAYMSPEQADGLIGQLDQRTDVYALGAILYEILTGQPPFRGSSALEILQQVRSGSLMPPTRRAPERAIPWELEVVVLQAMAQAPQARYQDVGALSADVERFLAGQVLSAADYSLPQRLRKWVGRNRTLTIAGLIVGVSLLVAAGISYASIRQRLAQEERVSRAAEAGQMRERRLREAQEAATNQAQQESQRAHAELRNASRRLAQALVFKADVALRDKSVLEALAYLAAARDVAPGSPRVHAARFAIPPPMITLERLVDCGGAVTDLSWSPAGTHLALAVAREKAPIVWDLQRWRRIKFPAFGESVVRVSFSPDGKLLAVSLGKGGIILYDVVTRRRKLTLQTDHVQHSLAWSYAAGRRRFASGGRGKVRLWNLATGKGQVIQADARWPVRALAFSPDGRYLASGNDIRRVTVRELATKRLVWDWINQTYYITGLAFSLDSKRLAVAGNGRDATVWQVGSWRKTATLRGHRAAIWGVQFTPAGELLTASWDGTLKLWNVEGELVRSVPCRGPGPDALAVSPDGRQLATAGKSGLLQIWRKQRGLSIRSRINHPQPIHDGRLSPDGKLVATCGYNRTVQLLEVSTGRLLKILGRHQKKVSRVVFSADGAWLASGGEDNRVMLWDVATQRLRHRLSGHTGPVPGLVFLRDGKTLVSGSHDRSVRFWDVASGRCLRTIGGLGSAVRSLALRTDGRLLAVGLGQGVLLIDPLTGRLRDRLKLPAVSAVTFAGRRVVAGHSSGLILLVDPRLPERQVRLEGHSSLIEGLRYNVATRLLVSGGYGGVVKFWDLDRGECVRTLDSPSEWGLKGVDISADGQLALTTRGHITFVWGLDGQLGSAQVGRISGVEVQELGLRPISPASFSKLRQRVANAAPPLWPEIADDRLNWGILRFVERAFHPKFLDEALDNFARAIELAPRAWLAWYYRGLALLAKGQRAEGLASLRRAKELAPARSQKLIERTIAGKR